MKTSGVFVSISRGGVTVNREVVIGLEDEQFMTRFKEFERQNSQYTCVFFTEKELDAFVRQIGQKLAGRVIIG